ncbi:MAG: PH domain-containing protein [Verrucomicrobiota bacterium]
MSEFPEVCSIRIIKDGKQLGPFSVDEILDQIEAGGLEYEDLGLRSGAEKAEPLHQILDWQEEKPARPVVARESTDSTSVERTKRENASTPKSQETRAAFPDRLLYRGHPSVLNHPLALIGLAGGLGISPFLYGYEPLFAIASLALGLVSAAYLSLDRWMNDFRITPSRIEWITGLIAKSSKEVRIEDLRAINVTCRGIKGMLGVGTVDFLTTGDKPEFQFTNVWAAKQVKGLVRELQDQRE